MDNKVRNTFLAAVAIVFSALLGCAYFSGPSPCLKYEDPVYVAFCESDLVIESAKAVLRDYSLAEVQPPDLDLVKVKVAEADALLLRAESVYRDTGKLLEGDVNALNSAVDLLEAWVNGA